MTLLSEAFGLPLPHPQDGSTDPLCTFVGDCPMFTEKNVFQTQTLFNTT